jgi:putative aldouronate transport system substrate-binding protein
MVVVFTFLLTGCGTQSTDNTSGSSSTAAGTVDSGAAAASTAAEQIGEFPLKDPVTLTAFTMNQFPTTDYSIDKNYVTDYIFKSTNIKLDFTYNVSGDDGKTKLNILMASGDKLPDIFIATGWSKAETLLYGQQKLILPLNDYLKDAPNWNKLNTESPLRKSVLTLPDGNVYTYGTDSECFHCMFQSRMWVYKPWVDKLNGGKMPTTTDELYAYLKLV